jgi:pantoate--beta-alanine ligase
MTTAVGTPTLARTRAELDSALAAASPGVPRTRHARAVVMTMGALHAGHLSLVRHARELADQVVVTIFVNPLQFGAGEDLSRYPRDLEGDLAKCAEAGIDRVLAPTDPQAMFAPSHETWVTVDRVSEGLCGAARPGHFRGVATVVAKLFNLTRPHVAFFGEKDFQQLAVIRAMVRDLAFGVEIVGMPIVREADGLALSSRNAYLSPEDRGRALALSRALREAADRAAKGDRDAERLRAGARERIAAAGARVDYVELVEPSTLAPVARAEPGSVMLVAAFFGTTRLIDNLRLP